MFTIKRNAIFVLWTTVLLAQNTQMHAWSFNEFCTTAKNNPKITAGIAFASLVGCVLLYKLLFPSKTCTQLVRSGSNASSFELVPVTSSNWPKGFKKDQVVEITNLGDNKYKWRITSCAHKQTSFSEITVEEYISFEISYENLVGYVAKEHNMSRKTLDQMIKNAGNQKISNAKNNPQLLLN